jgi:hypothetical protein
MAGGGGELNNKFQISTCYEAVWLILMWSSYDFCYMCYQVSTQIVTGPSLRMD